MSLLEVRNVKKVYTTRLGANQVQALSNVNFSVEDGEYVAIMGESGSGKTTLLNILAALDRPTAGEILLNGKNTVEIKNKELSAFRRTNLGFVFQDFNLLMELLRELKKRGYKLGIASNKVKSAVEKPVSYTHLIISRSIMEPMTGRHLPAC